MCVCVCTYIKNNPHEHAGHRVSKCIYMYMCIYVYANVCVLCVCIYIYINLDEHAGHGGDEFAAPVNLLHLDVGQRVGVARIPPKHRIVIRLTHVQRHYHLL